MWIAGWSCERRINRKTSTRSCGGSRVHNRLTHRGSSATPATARFVIGGLRILRGVDDMKIEEGMRLNEVRALMDYMWCSFNA